MSAAGLQNYTNRGFAHNYCNSYYPILKKETTTVHLIAGISAEYGLEGYKIVNSKVFLKILKQLN